MGNIVMPKQSADKTEMEAVLSVYKKHNDWLENSVLINDLKEIIGDSLENQAYTKKVQIPAYFGLIEWENPSSKTSRKKITERGLRFYDALVSKNQDDINEEIIKFLEELSFGRNVHGCSSNSDIEPPKVFIKASLFLSFLTRKEFGYILWQMDEFNTSLLKLMSLVKSNRLSDVYNYPGTPNKYNDAKPITVLYNWGLLQDDGTISGQQKIKLNDSLSIDDQKRLLKLDVKNNLTEIITIEEIEEIEEKPSDFIQKIFYGAPGTGKSHKVKELTKIPEEQGRVERITFHPEYDYSSFVGGYKPTMGKDEDGKEVIKYEFVAQALTNIYTKAWNDIDNKYYLVIEEINRGNCAEIFGDIFQLLDRTNNYKITPSKELKEHLKIELKDNLNIDAEKLLLPPNLNILATMNTSDQSLFPMDSAFKRRWDWEYIPINYSREEDKNSSAKFVVKLSNEESFKWLDFIEKVNEKISKNDNLGMDKCLGNYFIKSENDEIEIETFINKAIFYLWNDVFKDETEEDSIFKNKTTYENFFPIDDENGKQKVRDILEDLEIDYKASI